MQPIKLSRNPARIRMFIITSGIATFFIIGLGSWFISALLKSTFVNELVIIVLFVLFISCFWGLSTLIMVIKWRATAYMVHPEFVQVERSKTLTQTQTAMYRYESMVSVSINQGYYAKEKSYGDIKLKIPKLDNDVVLKDVNNPVEILQDIQQRINARPANVEALVN